jgi:hypothetical protein
MFARSFGIRTKDADLDNPSVTLKILTDNLQELVGKKPFKFTFFVDCDRKGKKIVFYDTTTLEHVMEFSTLFQRLPEYSIECDGKIVRVYRFHPETASATVFQLIGDSVITAVKADAEMTTQETAAILAVASTTDGFLDTAIDLSGTVVASIVANDAGEKRPFFTVKLDAKSPQNRALIRSCESMLFAWSDTDTSYMIFMCRFKMLPPFALTFPLIGRNVEEAANLYMETKKGVGMTMFLDDVSDAFQIENGRPTFEHT